MQTIRQGDLLFIPITPTGHGPEVNPEHRQADGIIREGEATGHHHRLAVLEDAEVFRAPYQDAVVVVSERGVKIVHEEHGPVVLQPSTTYRVHVAREFDYLASMQRYVRD